MALYKVAVTYITQRDTGARCTMVLEADDEPHATRQAHEAVHACSQEGVKDFRGVVVTRNSLGVEFIGRQPT